MAKTMRLLTISLAVFCMSTTLWAQTDADTDSQTQTSPDPDAYEVRLKIHKYASYATLPLFATELALGQSLYNNPDTGAKKGIHGAVGAGIIGLFGVNAVTGIWNLWESRHDENGRTWRVAHSVLML